MNLIKQLNPLMITREDNHTDKSCWQIESLELVRKLYRTLCIEDSIGHRDYIAEGANYEFCSLNTWPVPVLWLIYDRDFNVPRKVVRSIITLTAVSKRNFTGSPREFCRTFWWLPHNTYNLFSSVQHCNCAIIMNAAVHPPTIPTSQARLRILSRKLLDACISW